MTTATDQNATNTKTKPSALERKERKQQRQRHRLVLAAGATFAQFGYGDTTVADIIKMAEMSRRSFYEFFTSKESILEELYKEAHRQVFAEFGSLLSADPNLAAARSPMNEASYLIHAFLVAVRTYRYVRDPMPATTSQGPNDAYKALQEQMSDVLLDMVRGAQPTGLFSGPVTSVPIRFFLNGLSGLAHDRKTFDLEEEKQFMMAHAAALVLVRPLFVAGAVSA